MGSNAYRENALAEIMRAVEYDHYVWGIGHERPNGTIHIDVEASLTDLGVEYLRNYNESESVKDVIGRVHAAFPRYVQAWRVPPSPPKQEPHKAGKPPTRKDGYSRAAEVVGRYVQKEGHAEYLLLSGIVRPPHRAWLVLYRKTLGSKGPFTKREADYARHVIPARLYEWLELVKPWTSADGADEPEPLSPFGALTPYEASTVLLSVKHESPLAVANRLKDQFPEMVKELSQQDGEAKPWQVRVGAHVRNTKNSGLTGMGLGLSQVRSLLLQDRLPEPKAPPPA